MAISGLNSNKEALQGLNTNKAFKNNIDKGGETEGSFDIDKEGVKVTLSTPFSEETLEIKKENNSFFERHKAFIGEIKSFADKYNYQNIDNEEIQFALKNGTSLLVDRIA